MAQTLYCGLQRSGKSYEVVSNVILPSIEQGRDVISNIAGLNQQAMYDFLIAEGKNPDTFGKLKTVNEEQILTESFWLTDKDKTDEQKANKLIKAGDLVALDEIWRFFPADQKVPNYVMNFFRMHGHFVNQENGLTCEIALICQHPDDLHRALKRTVMTTFMMEKCTNLGLDKQYTIKVYNKTQISKKPLNTYGPLSYNKKYFPLYVSNSQNESGIKPREIRVEKRNSIFQTKLIKYGMPLAVFLLVGGIYGAMDFFNPESHNIKAAQAEQSKSNNSINPNTKPGQIQPVQSNRQWRVAGLFGITPNEKAILVNPQGQSKIVIPKTVSKYAETISITTYPKNETFDSEPFPPLTNSII